MSTRILCAAALLWGLATHAAASLTAVHRAEALTTHCCWDNPSSYNEMVGPGPVSAASWRSSAQADGTPGYGLLSGAVSAGASRDGGYSGAGASGTIRDYWSDSFTVLSASLGAGTPVDVRVTVDLDYSAMAQASSGGTSTVKAIAALHSGGPDAPWITGVQFEPGAGNLLGSTGSVLHGVATFASFVGANIHLVGDLYLYAGANAAANPSSASASLQGSARYTVSLLTEGAALSAASGSLYVTPVPEPQAAVMMLAGLAGLGMVIRRRRHTASRLPPAPAVGHGH